MFYLGKHMVFFSHKEQFVSGVWASVTFTSVFILTQIASAMLLYAEYAHYPLAMLMVHIDL